jgi:hypothetical protein
MQAPPPISSLLHQLETMAANVKTSLMRPDLDWYTRPESGEWSLTEVMCHLRDVESEVHQHRFQMLIGEDNAFIPGVSADEWAVTRNYQGQDGPKATELYLLARQETLSLLKSLAESYWQRQGRHAFFGPTSMHELLHLAVRHDELHWEQLTALLAIQNMKDNA